MRTYDLSPLFRSTIGFDRLFGLVEAARHAAEDNYPPITLSDWAMIVSRSRSRWPALHPTR
jgi:hypothetical protein